MPGKLGRPGKEARAGLGEGAELAGRDPDPWGPPVGPPRPAPGGRAGMPLGVAPGIEPLPVPWGASGGLAGMGVPAHRSCVSMIVCEPLMRIAALAPACAQLRIKSSTADSPRPC